MATSVVPRAGTGLDIRARCDQHGGVLAVRTLAAADGAAVAEVACRGEPPRGSTEQAQQHALVFVRRGWFSRRHEGRRVVIDPERCYTFAPGDEHAYDHEHGQDDDCTYVTVAPDLLHQIVADGRLPVGPFPSSPSMHLAQRALVASARRGETDALLERVLALVAAVLPASHRTVPARDGASARRHAALVEDARERLAADPGLPLTALAGLLAVSPHHLSRLFRARAGVSVSRYRMRLRARLALERIDEGERDLAALAADLGLADQSHLNRLLRTELGRTPTQLRRDRLR